MSVERRYMGAPPATGTQNLADILERVLDKGIVIAGDIQVNLLDIELLTVKLRLVIASVDKAREIGIDWWQSDPFLSEHSRLLADENRALKERVESLESSLGLEPDEARSVEQRTTVDARRDEG